MKLTEIEKLIGNASSPTVPYSAAANAICAAEQRLTAKLHTLAIEEFKWACQKSGHDCILHTKYGECSPERCHGLYVFMVCLGDAIAKI